MRYEPGVWPLGLLGVLLSLAGQDLALVSDQVADTAWRAVEAVGLAAGSLLRYLG